MRSRYSAFTRGEMAYIKETLAPESRDEFDLETTSESAKQVKWKELRILKSDDAMVEFVAVYEHAGQNVEHHEISQFRRDESGRLFYVDGQILSEPTQKTVKRESPKVGRNDPCPCGSGKKSKKCCAA